MKLIELIEKRRIALCPEYEGGWHADVYDQEDVVQYKGYGGSISEAIHDALQFSSEEIYEGE